MRHYEVVFLVHPDQSAQVAKILEQHQQIITEKGGVIHRLEDWGLRPLAYIINGNIHKAHYILMNIECDADTRTKLEESLRFNDAILRNLLLRRDDKITADSPIKKTIEAEETRKAEEQRKKQLREEREKEQEKEQEKEELSVEPAAEVAEDNDTTSSETDTIASDVSVAASANENTEKSTEAAVSDRNAESPEPPSGNEDNS